MIKKERQEKRKRIEDRVRRRRNELPDKLSDTQKFLRFSSDLDVDHVLKSVELPESEEKWKFEHILEDCEHLNVWVAGIEPRVRLIVKIANLSDFVFRETKWGGLGRKLNDLGKRNQQLHKLSKKLKARAFEIKKEVISEIDKQIKAHELDLQHKEHDSNDVDQDLYSLYSLLAKVMTDVGYSQEDIVNNLIKNLTRASSMVVLDEIDNNNLQAKEYLGYDVEYLRQVKEELKGLRELKNLLIERINNMFFRL